MRREADVPWPGEERRPSERIELGLACVYTWDEPVNQERSRFHHGMGKVLNMSGGGMLLLLDTATRLEQVIQVHLFSPRTDRTISLLRVIWTRPHEDRQHYLAGGKFVFGPYSLSQGRICAPTELISS